MIPRLKNLLDRFGNKELIFINTLPTLAYVDEVKFKKDEKTVLLFLDTYVDDYSNVSIIFKNDNYDVKEYIHHRYTDNTYHHTELLLYRRMLILTAKPDNLIVYRNNITVEECELNNEDDIINIFNNYNLVTVKESDIIADNNIIDSSITHIISIPFKYNITSANVIKIKDNYYDIIGIKNLDELDEYLILYCAKYKDNERI